MTSTLLGKFACRFCHHDQYMHNPIVGCPYCRCLATPGEAGPRTEVEDGYEILSPGQILPGMERMERDGRREGSPPVVLPGNTLRDVIREALHHTPGVECSHVPDKVPECVRDADHVTKKVKEWMNDL